MKVDGPVELGPIETAEAAKEWFPQDIFLDAAGHEIVSVSHHVVVHDAGNAARQALWLIAARVIVGLRVVLIRLEHRLRFVKSPVVSRWLHRVRGVLHWQNYRLDRNRRQRHFYTVRIVLGAAQGVPGACLVGPAASVSSCLGALMLLLDMGFDGLELL